MIKRADLIATAIALCVPGVTTWLFFYGFPGDLVTGWLYSGSKVFMIAFPCAVAVRAMPRFEPPSKQALMLGVGFGAVLFVCTLALYLVLRDKGVFSETGPVLTAKMREFGVTSGIGFLGLATFITLFNSSLEEYYWRWFLFRRVAIHGVPVLAAVVSSAAFMAHHAVVLSHYFPDTMLWTATVPFTVFTGIGGAIWCFIYWRSGSLWAPWISHVLVDAAIMIVGADLLYEVLA